MRLEIERAELEGLSLKCLDGCAYCCLCPAEVFGADRVHFSKEHPQALEDLDGTPHIGLQGESGACRLLKGRRCVDYGHRPFHCRAYPLRVHMSYRVQACANLSCRGLVRRTTDETDGAGPSSISQGQENGQPLTQELDSLLQGEAAGRLAHESQIAAREWNQFLEKSRRHSIEVELEGSRFAVSGEIERWPNGLELDRQEVLELVIDTFSAQELSQLPVYTAPNLEWWLFRIRGEDIERLLLSEDGSLKPDGKWPLRAVPVLELSSDGADELKSYMELLNHRDSMAASAALVSKLTKFEEEFDEVYYENLRDCALDLIWRASLLAFVKNESVLGAKEIREGIIFSDADFLDMPGVGGML
jgi:hypothetical protein